MVELHMTERDTIPSLLAGVGLTPRQVPILVMSHLHYDHAASLSLFRHADIYVQQAELDFAHAPPVYQSPFYTPHQYSGDYNWKLLDGSLDLFGDGSVEIFPYSRPHPRPPERQDHPRARDRADPIRRRLLAREDGTTATPGNNSGTRTI